MKKQEKKTPLLDLEALHFILVMSIYETYCWQIYRLDQTCLGSVMEHRVHVSHKDDSINQSLEVRIWGHQSEVAL